MMDLTGNNAARSQRPSQQINALEYAPKLFVIKMLYNTHKR